MNQWSFILVGTLPQKNRCRKKQGSRQLYPYIGSVKLKKSERRYVRVANSSVTKEKWGASSWRSQVICRETPEPPACLKFRKSWGSGIPERGIETLWHWFSLILFPSGKRWGNGKVAESVEKYCWTSVSQNAQVKAAISGCRAEGNLLWGKVAWKPPWNQKVEE